MRRIFLILILSQISFTMKAQSQIAVEKKTVYSKNYNYTRRLKDYVVALEDTFSEFMPTLKENDVWLDSGAGDALAQVDYLKNGGVAKLVAVDARETDNQEALELLRQFPDHFHYLQGKFTENYRTQELFPLKLITDVCGAIAYSSHLDQVLRVLLGSLSPGGRLYFEMDDSTSIDFVNPTGDRLIIIRMSNGSEVNIPVGEYFRSIKGAEFKLGHVAYGGDGQGPYFIRTNEELVVPNLTIRDYQEGSPPRKIYILK